jgi:protein-S-isoprenylcysteine O-methyltransferase Ste14
MDRLRAALLVVMVLGPLFFLDAPRLTVGQPFILKRARERAVLLAADLTAIGLWVLFKFYLRWDRTLLRASLEGILFAMGAPLALAAVGLAVWGKLRLGRWFSATFGVKPGHVLVTDGPYAVVRHPIYAGLLGAALGGALAWNSLLTLALAAGLTVPLFFHTVHEEALFEAHFGAPYRDYQRRVPRLVPWPRRART